MRAKKNPPREAGATTTYLYNALGQRLRKSGGPAGTVLYVYDEGGQLLGEYDGSGNATREYVWLGPMPLAVLSTAETIRDNPASANTVYVGTWAAATTPTGFYGANYQTHPAAAAGTPASANSVTWNLALPTGTYKVYARWPANASHSTQARYTVIHATGSTQVTVNQRQDGAEWALLGTFSMTSANSKVRLVPSADGPVAADAVKAVNTSEAGRIFFVHADHLDAPRVVVDSSNRLRWRWISDPWGQLPPEENPAILGTFSLNLRLPGQLYDRESNLHYNYFRDYSPETGRYIQSDPIGLAGGINTYAYVEGNPLSKIDPDGLQAIPMPPPLLPPPTRPADPFTPRPAQPLLPGWLRDLVRPMPMDALAKCEAECAAQWDIDQKLCAAWWMTTGRNPSAYQSCMARANARLVACYQDCKKTCQ